MSRKARHEPHVRLYKHELQSAAYRSLSPEARALLIEMRALYAGKENRVFMSLREIMRRTGVGRCKAEKARDELLDRGFIRLVEKGEFKRKVRHASIYRLTNEPTNPEKDGSTPTKDFMKWQPEKKMTVLMTSTDGVDGQHRGTKNDPSKRPHGVDDQHRKGPIYTPHGVDEQHTDKLPGVALDSGAVELLNPALAVDDSEVQFKLILGALIQNGLKEEAA